VTIQVREYATLTTDRNQESSLDSAVVSKATFDWLLDLHQQWSGRAEILSERGRQRLKLGSHVGYLESPSGEGIEILPKTEIVGQTEPNKLRSLLQTMLRSSADLPSREASKASLQATQQPLHEWIIGEFLRELAELVRRGLRFDYQTVENESRFVRGQLDINRQIRQTPDKATHFHVRYAEFNPQRRENRLLRSALDSVIRLTKDNDHWRLANMLSHQLIDIEPYRTPIRELSHWNNGKQLQTYRSIKPWCRLVLLSLNPNFQKGLSQGIALLFPMERLFENYLGKCLGKQLLPPRSLKLQARSRYLLSHTVNNASDTSQWFQLKPDFLVTYRQMNHTVLDAKWKLIDSKLNSSKDKYNIQQSDMYQMFAYGQKYLGGKGVLALIYPEHENFRKPLPVFSFSEDLALWVIPFDLHQGILLHDNLLDSFERHTHESVSCLAS